MGRFTCKSSVTDGDGEHQAGDVIELTDAQAAQLLDAGAIEALKKPAAMAGKSEPLKSEK